MKTILICGATGFIGRNAVNYFNNLGQYHIKGTYHIRPPFSNPSIEWIKADLTNPLDVQAALENVDILVQAAATTSGVKDIVNAPYMHVTDNVLMNSIIFRAAHDLGIKHVIFFSCTIMLSSSEIALTEDDLDLNASVHPNYFGAAWTKIYLEKMCEFYSRIGRQKFTVLRHSNIYGPFDKFELEKSHVFGASITKVMTASDGKIIIWGDGTESRDLLYVKDLIECVDKAISYQSEKFAIFNCGYGSAITVVNLIKKILNIANKKLEIQFDLGKPTIKTSLFLDCNKVKEAIGWKRNTLLDDGIKMTIDWWSENIGNKY